MQNDAPILLLTRPAPAARRFAAQVGADVATIFAPLLRIDWLDPQVDLRGLTGLILTSENGATAAARLAGLPPLAFCVGDQTARVAQDAGFRTRSAGGDAAALVDLILSQGVTGPLLHLCGEHVRGDITARLNAAGIVTRQAVAYAQTALPLSPQAVAALAGPCPVILPLFSPRTVTIIAQSGPFLAVSHVVAISASVADLARMLHPATMCISDRPDAKAMVEAVQQVLATVTKGPGSA